MDGQYQERYENIRRTDGRQEGVVKDGGNGRHTLVYKTHSEKMKTMAENVTRTGQRRWLTTADITEQRLRRTRAGRASLRSLWASSAIACVSRAFVAACSSSLFTFILVSSAMIWEIIMKTEYQVYVKVTKFVCRWFTTKTMVFIEDIREKQCH